MLAGFDTHLFWEALSSGPYWRGALTALELAGLSLVAAIAIGFIVALGTLSTRRSARAVAWVYNWVFRATPTLLQLMFIWYAAPQIWSGFAGSWFTPFMAAFIALSLNEAAYMSEIIRAGLLSVDPGQALAGRALGLSNRRIMRRIVVPQAVRIAIPPTGNEFITLLKLTSIATVISLHELLSAATDRASSSFHYTEPLLASLVYYLAIVSVLMVVQSRLEQRFTFTSAGRGRRRRDRAAAPAVAPVHEAR